MKAHLIRIPMSTNGRNDATGAIDISDISPLPVAGYQHKRASRLQEDYLLVPYPKSYAPICRLMVLVPAGKLDERRLGLQIGQIALPRRMPILFLALASSPEVDSSLRRRLITLSSLVKDRQIKTSTRLAFHENWIKAIEEVWEEGDLLVCIEAHRTQTFLFRRMELARHLISTLGVPVYVLTRIQLSKEPMQWGGWQELLIWASAITVIILFGFLQFLIETTFQGSVSTLLFSLSVVVEALLIWRLNFLR